uniref:Uncharacterized protein n=1 Tax=Anopheles arabiensis TaxID=7173 RepID=A0A499FT81_ANOAR
MGNPNAGPCGMRLALGDADLRRLLGLCIFCHDVVMFVCRMCRSSMRICPYDVLHDGQRFHEHCAQRARAIFF